MAKHAPDEQDRRECGNLQAKSTGPGEIKGPSIKGGTRKNVAPGDVVHIPAKMPHQFFLEPGHEITYLAVKVNSL